MTRSALNDYRRRASCAWACLRGYPVAYRLHIDGGLRFGPEAVGGRMMECTIDGGARPDYGIKIDQ